MLWVTVLFLTTPGGSRKTLEKSKGAKASTVPTPGALPGAHYGEAALTSNSGLTLRDPVIGAQFVQIQLLQVRH